MEILILMLLLVGASIARGSSPVTVASVWTVGTDWKFDANFDITLSQNLNAGFKIVLQFEKEVKVTAVWQFQFDDSQDKNTYSRCWKLKAQTWNPTFTSGQHLKSGMQVQVSKNAQTDQPSGNYGSAFVEGTQTAVCSGGGQAGTDTSTITVSANPTQAATTGDAGTVQPTTDGGVIQTEATTSTKTTVTSPTIETVTKSTCGSSGCVTSTEKYTVTTSGQCKCKCPSGNN